VQNFLSFSSFFALPIRFSFSSTKYKTSSLFRRWFHGFLSNAEAERLLEPCEVGTFLVRFSRSDPGSFAINLKSADRPIGIKVDTTPNG
jgi:hypothetical protein